MPDKLGLFSLGLSEAPGACYVVFYSYYVVYVVFYFAKSQPEFMCPVSMPSLSTGAYGLDSDTGDLAYWPQSRHVVTPRTPRNLYVTVLTAPARSMTIPFGGFPSSERRRSVGIG